MARLDFKQEIKLGGIGRRIELTDVLRGWKFLIKLKDTQSGSGENVKIDFDQRTQTREC